MIMRYSKKLRKLAVILLPTQAVLRPGRLIRISSSGKCTHHFISFSFHCVEMCSLGCRYLFVTTANIHTAIRVYVMWLCSHVGLLLPLCMRMAIDCMGYV